MAWRFLWAVPTAIPDSVYWVQVSTSGGKLEKMRVTHRSHPDAQEAITDYQVLGPSALGCTWLELHPLTGRKHQIRVHCAEVLGTPIVGDYKYGWCALKNWPPKDEHNPENTLAPNDCKRRQKGDIFSNTPLLHLHCHKLSLPNVARIFKHQESAKTDYEAGHRMVQSCDDVLDVVAPLPPHMASSWNEKLVSGVDL
jgi:23S rRNA-/tRNA-specific pseudouridylate synthase